MVQFLSTFVLWERFMKKIGILLFTVLSLVFSSCGTKSPAGSELFRFTGDMNYKSPKQADPKDAVNQSTGLEKNWWKKSVFYHIWVKSFNNSNGKTGNFKGIEEKLDYINETLGCDAIWLSPVFTCSDVGFDESSIMHGYNAEDYYSINYAFGQTEDANSKDSEKAEEDLISLINACHARNMKIIFDFVPNHASYRSKWFLESAEGNTSKKDWFVWSPKKLTNWNNGMSSDTWFYNEKRGEYYYGAFGSGVPDLNFYNYEVREEMKNVMRFWLNKGFDGIRVDAIRYLMEEPNKYVDTDSSNEWFKELRKEIDRYDSPKFMVCENWITGNRTKLTRPFGNDDEFNMIFDFDQGGSILSNIKNSTNTCINGIYDNPTENTCFGIFLGNHDQYQPRVGTALGGDYKKIKLADALILLRPNIPFIYHGQELGMKNAPYDGDSALRGNFNWVLEEKEEGEADSPLKINRAVITLRRKYEDLFAAGKVIKLVSQNGQFSTKFGAYIIKHEDKKILVAANFSPVSMKTVTFTGNNLNLSGNKSCLIGNPAAVCEMNGNTVTLNNFGPYAVRVYDLTENGLASIYNDETYDENNEYKPSDVIPITVTAPTTMYLRGTMNGWGGSNPMTISTDNSTVREWTCTVNFAKATSIQFKFCVNGDEDWQANWGLNGGEKNIAINVNAGDRIFTFSFNKKTGEVGWSVK